MYAIYLHSPTDVVCLFGIAPQRAQCDYVVSIVSTTDATHIVLHRSYLPSSLIKIAMLTFYMILSMVAL